MNCLCCGKPLSAAEEQSGWHKRCVRHFFGTAAVPEIEIDERALQRLASESTNKGFTVPGVQKKLSLHLFSEGKNPRLTLVNYPTGYILKPQVEQFEALPEAEQLVMSMADIAGIRTVPHALIQKGGEFAYITRRVDHVIDKNVVRMFAMEDFCQLDLRLTEDKYRGSYERCARIVKKYSCQRGLDMAELYMRLVFCFLVGNSDMHLKNFSLIETEERSGRYVLSPAYDLLPVNVIMPEDQEEFALTMNGKKRNLRRKDFLVYADECGISQVPALKMIRKLVSLKPRFIAMCEESFLPEEMKGRLVQLIRKRCEIFEEQTRKTVAG